MQQTAADGGLGLARGTLSVRRIRAADVPDVVALDARTTGLAKPDYWQDVFRRYGERRTKEYFFLVAETSPADDREGRMVGFIVGEIRAWEFGSAPCGWVWALSVDPDTRQQGVGEAMFQALCAEFKRAGVTKIRTMVARDNALPHSFFRGQGMMAGPYLQLEKELE